MPFKALGALSKLKSLLNDKNLELLDTLLYGITDQNSEPFNSFWIWFRKKHPDHTEQAWRALNNLRNILKEYRGN